MAVLKCAGCAAKDETIEILREEVRWLRASLGTPTYAGTPVDAPEPDKRFYTSEDEDDIHTMAERELLGREEAEAALARIDAMNTEIEVHP